MVKYIHTMEYYTIFKTVNRPICTNMRRDSGYIEKKENCKKKMFPKEFFKITYTCVHTKKSTTKSCLKDYKPHC